MYEAHVGDNEVFIEQGREDWMRGKQRKQRKEGTQTSLIVGQNFRIASLLRESIKRLQNRSTKKSVLKGAQVPSSPPSVKPAPYLSNAESLTTTHFLLGHNPMPCQTFV